MIADGEQVCPECGAFRDEHDDGECPERTRCESCGGAFRVGRFGVGVYLHEIDCAKAQQEAKLDHAWDSAKEDKEEEVP